MKNRMISNRVLACALTIIMCFSLASVAIATANDSVGANDLMNQHISDNAHTEYAFTSGIQNYSVNTGVMEMLISKNVSGLVELSVAGGGSDYAVQMLPASMNKVFSNANIVGYAAEDESWVSILIAQEETAKQISVLYNATAPSTFEYEFDLPSGSYMDFARHEYTGRILNGTINIYDSTNTGIGAVNAPVVVDADGIELESYFTIRDNVLVQTIVIDENTVYPISSTNWIAPISTVAPVADTATILKYFTSPTILWNRDGQGKHSLSLGGRTWDTETRHIHEQPAWRAVKACYDSISALWTNEESLYDQYMCHSNLAQLKDPWNLEPWRPTVAFVTLELCLCNYPNCLWD